MNQPDRPSRRPGKGTIIGGVLLGLALAAATVISYVPKTRASALRLLTELSAYPSEHWFAFAVGQVLIAACGVLPASVMAVMGRSASARLAGYAMGLLAGLLKFYPMLVMLSALREKPARFFGITAASIIVTLLAAAVTWHDLVRTWMIVPQGSPIYEMFGAPNFGKGLVVLFHLPPPVGSVLRGVMTLVALAIGIRYGLRPATGAAMAQLSVRERDFLLIGALMTIGCFMSAQNISYRTINLLLVLPSLTALRIVDAPRALKAMALVAIGLLWAELLFHWVQAFAAIAGGTLGTVLEFGLGWLGREIAWWWTVTLLIACATALIRPLKMVDFAIGLRRQPVEV